MTIEYYTIRNITSYSAERTILHPNQILKPSQLKKGRKYIRTNIKYKESIPFIFIDHDLESYIIIKEKRGFAKISLKDFGVIPHQNPARWNNANYIIPDNRKLSAKEISLSCSRNDKDCSN